VARAQAEGQLAKDQAVLKNSELDLARYKTLVAQNSIARQTLDTQAALVQQNRGTVQADQAQVDTQKLNLTYCRIVSPISGRVGLRQVDPGNIVHAADDGLVVITQCTRSRSSSRCRKTTCRRCSAASTPARRSA
jgi:multidrug efflux system membrane fusion protein